MRHVKTLPLALLLVLATALFAQDLSGTYTGIVKSSTPDGAQDEGGTIVIKQDGGKLIVTAGPTTGEQYAANKVIRDGDSLKFEVGPIGEPVRTLRFDVTVREGKMTGTVTSSIGGESGVGKLEFTKQ